MKDKLPIGYYLKNADRLLTEGINHIHQEMGITRTDWQILNSIHENDKIDLDKIAELLKAFADKETIIKAVKAMAKRQLITDNQFLSLTEEGKKLYVTCLQKQKAFRQKSMEGLTQEQYEQTISFLEKLIDNLK